MKKIFIIVTGLLMFFNLEFVVSQNVFTVTKTTDLDPFVYPYNYNNALCDTAMKKYIIRQQVLLVP